MMDNILKFTHPGTLAVGPCAATRSVAIARIFPPEHKHLTVEIGIRAV